jgi:dTDP-4-dehydrorhamnose 3,5-epimerase
MEIAPTAIPDLRLVRPARHSDQRGVFWEGWNRARFAAAGVKYDFVQDNFSISPKRGTVRGLHFQAMGFAQAKLVHCLHGAIFDVAVDLRRSSPTFGKHVTTILSADERTQVLIPEGFAHGYCTLEPDTLVAYKASAYWAPERERGVRWNDPALAIAWPVDEANAVISERDRAYPPFAALADAFD